MGESKLVLRLILNKEEYEKKMQRVKEAIAGFGANINSSLNQAKTGLISLTSQFGGFGRVVSGLIEPIQKVGKAIKIAFTSNPIGLIIAAIALLVAAVYSFFTRTQEGGDKLKVIWVGIKGAIQAILDVLSAVGTAIFSLLTGDWDGFKENLRQVKDEFNEIGNKTLRAVELQKQLIALHVRKFGTVKEFKQETSVDMSKVQNLASIQDQFIDFTLKLTNIDISHEARANFLVKQKRLLAEMSKQSKEISDGMGDEAKMSQLAQYGSIYRNLSKDSTRSVKERLDYALKYETIQKSIIAMKTSTNADELNIVLGKFNNNNSNSQDLEDFRKLQVGLYNDVTATLGTIKEIQSEINTLKQSETAELLKQKQLHDDIAQRKNIATNSTAITPNNMGVISVDVLPNIILPKDLISNFISAVQVPIEETGIQIGEMFNSMLSSGVMLLAEGFGEMIGGGSSFGKMLMGLLDMLKQFGAALIAAGVARIAFDAVLNNPLLAIAAGAALVIAVSVAQARLKNVSNFADGGIVYGETFARVGEYAGASSNPEVIAPLNKLKQLIKPQSSQQQFGEVRFEIQGQNLVGLLNKINKFNSRM